MSSLRLKLVSLKYVHVIVSKFLWLFHSYYENGLFVSQAEGDSPINNSQIICDPIVRYKLPESIIIVRLGLACELAPSAVYVKVT